MVTELTMFDISKSLGTTLLYSIPWVFGFYIIMFFLGMRKQNSLEKGLSAEEVIELQQGQKSSKLTSILSVIFVIYFPLVTFLSAGGILSTGRSVEIVIPEGVDKILLDKDGIYDPSGYYVIKEDGSRGKLPTVRIGNSIERLQEALSKSGEPVVLKADKKSRHYDYKITVETKSLLGTATAEVHEIRLVFKDVAIKENDQNVENLPVIDMGS